jgi:hypothetical protein
MPEVSALALLGRPDEARAAMQRAKRLKPDASVAFVDLALPFSQAADRAHFLRGLVEAGLPD